MNLTRGSSIAIALGLISLVPQISEFAAQAVSTFTICRGAMLPLISIGTALLGLVFALFSKPVTGKK